jgi:hypothetical protein
MLLVLFTLLLNCALPGASSPAPERVTAGTWGGRGAGLVVAEEGVRFELDCAHGKVTGTLPLRKDGTFEATGFFFQERPGPQRAEEEEEGRPAKISGRVQGSEMQLTLQFSDTGEEIGT